MKPRLLDLAQGRKTIVDEGDFPLVNGLTLYLGFNGYVYFSQWIGGKSQPRTLHGLLVAAPRGSHVDHINGNKLDNRRANLRVVSPQLNQVNRKRLNRNNTSGVRGVAFHPESSPSRPWRAQITAQRKCYHLGCFVTKEAAIQARKEAEIRFYGEACP